MRTPVFFDQLLREDTLPTPNHTPRIASSLSNADSIVKRKTSNVTKNCTTTTTITDYYKKTKIVPVSDKISPNQQEHQCSLDFYNGKKLVQNTAYKKYVSK